MKSNSDFSVLLYTDCLFRPSAFLWSLEIYGVVYKDFATNITTCPDYPRCNFNSERIYDCVYAWMEHIYTGVAFKLGIVDITGCSLC